MTDSVNAHVLKLVTLFMNSIISWMSLQKSSRFSAIFMKWRNTKCKFSFPIPIMIRDKAFISEHNFLFNSSLLYIRSPRQLCHIIQKRLIRGVTSSAAQAVKYCVSMNTVVEWDWKFFVNEIILLSVFDKLICTFKAVSLVEFYLVS